LIVVVALIVAPLWTIVVVPFQTIYLASFELGEVIIILVAIYAKL
jgi:hypothetical protein